MSKPKDFFITTISRSILGKDAGSQDLIVENPNEDILENNGIHVIEKSAYDRAVGALRFYANRGKKTNNKTDAAYKFIGEHARKTLEELGEL